MRKKQLWVLAGGNGAGKTTFYQLYLKDRGLAFINADVIAKKIVPQSPENASYQAARLAENLRIEWINRGRSFCFETVFSHPSKVDFMSQAKACGYEIILVYIHLINDELNQARVAQRVSEGGHKVPTEKIKSRIPRTIKNITSALPLADIVKIYDNSSREQPYRAVAQISYGKLFILEGNLPKWAMKILEAESQKPEG